MQQFINDAKREQQTITQTYQRQQTHALFPSYCGSFSSEMCSTSSGNNAAKSFTSIAPSIDSNPNVIASLPPEFVVTRPFFRSNDLPTHPVPEFLCHVLSMVQDPTLSHIISWEVNDEFAETSEAKDMKGTGKIVIHNPTQFEQQVLGKFYRHSKFSSFQRQMNYFNFRKRILHGGRGKMHACDFVNVQLGKEPECLLRLKRRMKQAAKGDGGAKDTAHAAHIRNKTKYQYTNVRGNRFSDITLAAGDARSVKIAQMMMHKTANQSALHQTRCMESKNTANGYPTTERTEAEKNMFAKSMTNISSLMPTHFLFSISSMNQALPVSNPCQTHPDMSAAIVPKLFNNSFSNSFINTKNIDGNYACAAAQAKQSLFHAYQQSQLDILRNDLNQSSHVVGQASSDLSTYVPTQCKAHCNRIAVPISVVTHPDSSPEINASPLLKSMMTSNPILPVARTDNEERVIPLPSSIDKLFDEGSVCSLLCDEDELIDTDECSLLSMELGLVG